MYHIYKLIDSRYPDVCLYVGETQRPKKRISQHKNVNQKYSIREYPDKKYIKLIILETLNYDEDIKFVIKRENYYINLLNPIYNIRRTNPHHH